MPEGGQIPPPPRARVFGDEPTPLERIAAALERIVALMERGKRHDT